MESEEYFQDLSRNATDEQIQLWDAQVVEAQANRSTLISSMDKFDSQLAARRYSTAISIIIANLFTEAPTCSEKQLELAKEEINNPHHQGISRWLFEGIKIQETQ